MNRGGFGNGVRMTTSPVGLVSNIAEFGNDFATLAELQGQLAVQDARECASRAATPVIAIAVSALLMLAAMPVLLLAAADLISTSAGLSIGLSRLIVAGGSIVIAAVVGSVALGHARRSLESFRRSREELVRNVSWIRTVLVHSGRSTRRF
jgi:hypothetical protein